jgi:hypothetical protein
MVRLEVKGSKLNSAVQDNIRNGSFTLRYLLMKIRGLFNFNFLFSFLIFCSQTVYNPMYCVHLSEVHELTSENQSTLQLR